MRKLGPIGDKDTENEVLLLEHDVPHGEFIRFFRHLTVSFGDDILDSPTVTPL